jgi:hypothetical protein
MGAHWKGESFMKKTRRMLARQPRTMGELSFRTTQRLGAMALATLAIFLLIKFWWLVLIIGVIALIVFIVRK